MILPWSFFLTKMFALNVVFITRIKFLGTHKQFQEKEDLLHLMFFWSLFLSTPQSLISAITPKFCMYPCLKKKKKKYTYLYPLNNLLALPKFLNFI